MADSGAAATTSVGAAATGSGAAAAGAGVGERRFVGHDGARAPTR